MQLEKIIYPKAKEYHNRVLLNIQKNGIEIQVGTVFLSEGSRIPNQGFTQHEEEEISIMVKGKIAMLRHDGSVKNILTAGKIVYIESGELHAGNVIEDTKIIYLLIRNKTV